MNRDENGSDQEKECRHDHYAEENRNEKDLAPFPLFFLLRNLVFHSLRRVLRACSAHSAGLQYGQTGSLWGGTFFRAGAGAAKLCEKAP